MVNDLLCKDGQGFLFLSTNDYKIFENKQLEPFGSVGNRAKEMEKINYKNKVTGAVINAENYEKLPMNIKNDFYLTAEEPTHTIEFEKDKPSLVPIFSERELKNAANEKTNLTKEQAEQSTTNEPPAGKTKKAKGEKS